METPFPAFLLRYQEPVPALNPVESLGAGTMTKTSARESSDQDISADWLQGATNATTGGREQADQSRPHLALATQTQTRTREGVDQDPFRQAILGTRTHTDSREMSDNDPSHAGWAIIPRA